MSVIRLQYGNTLPDNSSKHKNEGREYISAFKYFHSSFVGERFRHFLVGLQTR